MLPSCIKFTIDKSTVVRENKFKPPCLIVQLLNMFKVCCEWGLRLRANGRNIVGQQLSTLLDVTCCVRLHTLLDVVTCCWAKFETGQTFSPVQTDTTLLGAVESVYTDVCLSNDAL